MKYSSLNQTVTNKNSYEEKMHGRRICESVDAAEIQYQAKKAKRYRSAFTTGQINYLEKQFKKFPYIGNACRKEVASVLNIPERAVKIWFQNRRMKEKKEVINKEYNLDRPNNSINNVEFVNDLLNNVHSSQSANDRQYSLQPALSNDVHKINYTNYNVEVKKSDIIKSEKNLRQIKHDKLYQPENKNINQLEKPTISKIMPSKTANFSKIHLNKVYNNNAFMKYLETNKNETTNKCKLAPKKKIKENFKTGNQPVLDVPNNILGTINYQDFPEDLSARNKSNVTVPQNHTENINLSSAYIPFCNTQNYVTPCVSAGNLMWKPINVMPVISSPPPNIVVIDNELINQNNMLKSNCNCDCHIKNLFNYKQGNLSAGTTHPQYVIAIPINNSLS